MADMSSTEPLPDLSTLRELGKRRRAVAGETDAMIAAEVSRLRAANRHGYAMETLADAVGLSRQGLYDLLARHERKGR